MENEDPNRYTSIAPQYIEAYTTVMLATTTAGLVAATLVLACHGLMTYYHCAEINRVSLRLIVLSCVFDVVRGVFRYFMFLPADTVACAAESYIVGWCDVATPLCLAMVGLHTVFVLVLNVNNPRRFEKYYYAFILIYCLVCTSVAVPTRLADYPASIHCWVRFYFGKKGFRPFEWTWYYTLLLIPIAVSSLCSLVLIIRYKMERYNFAETSVRYAPNNNPCVAPTSTTERIKPVDPIKTFRNVIIRSTSYAIVPVISKMWLIVAGLRTLKGYNADFVPLIIGGIFATTQGVLVSLIYFSDPTVVYTIKKFGRYLRRVYVDEYELPAKEDNDYTSYPAYGINSLHTQNDSTSFDSTAGMGIRLSDRNRDIVPANTLEDTPGKDGFHQRQQRQQQQQRQQRQYRQHPEQQLLQQQQRPTQPQKSVFSCASFHFSRKNSVSNRSSIYGGDSSRMINKTTQRQPVDPYHYRWLAKIMHCLLTKLCRLKPLPVSDSSSTLSYQSPTLSRLPSLSSQYSMTPLQDDDKTSTTHMAEEKDKKMTNSAVSADTHSTSHNHTQDEPTAEAGPSSQPADQALEDTSPSSLSPSSLLPPPLSLDPPTSAKSAHYDHGHTRATTSSPSAVSTVRRLSTLSPISSIMESRRPSHMVSFSKNRSAASSVESNQPPTASWSSLSASSLDSRLQSPILRDARSIGRKLSRDISNDPSLQMFAKQSKKLRDVMLHSHRSDIQKQHRHQQEQEQEQEQRQQDVLPPSPLQLEVSIPTLSHLSSSEVTGRLSLLSSTEVLRTDENEGYQPLCVPSYHYHQRSSKSREEQQPQRGFKPRSLSNITIAADASIAPLSLAVLDSSVPDSSSLESVQVVSESRSAGKAKEKETILPVTGKTTKTVVAAAAPAGEASTVVEKKEEEREKEEKRSVDGTLVKLAQESPLIPSRSSSASAGTTSVPSSSNSSVVMGIEMTPRYHALSNNAVKLKGSSVKVLFDWDLSGDMQRTREDVTDVDGLEHGWTTLIHIKQTWTCNSEEDEEDDTNNNNDRSRILSLVEHWYRDYVGSRWFVVE